MSASVLDPRVTLKTGSRAIPDGYPRGCMSNRLTVKTVENIKPSRVASRSPRRRNSRHVSRDPAERGEELRPSISPCRQAAQTDHWSGRNGPGGGAQARGERAGRHSGGQRPAVGESRGKGQGQGSGPRGRISKRGLVEAVIAEFIEKHVRRSTSRAPPGICAAAREGDRRALARPALVGHPALRRKRSCSTTSSSAARQLRQTACWRPPEVLQMGGLARDHCAFALRGRVGAVGRNAA